MKQIDMWGIDMVFVVGGNGGNAGANAIQQVCEQQVRWPPEHYFVGVCGCAPAHGLKTDR